VLDGLTDTSSFYQVVDAIEQQGMEKDVIDKVRNKRDQAIIEQIALYEKAVQEEYDVELVQGASSLKRRHTSSGNRANRTQSPSLSPVMSPTVTPEVVRKEQKRLEPVIPEIPSEKELPVPTKEMSTGIGSGGATPPRDTVDVTENESETKTGKKKKTVIVKKTVKQKKLMAAERRKQAATRDLEKEADVAVIVNESLTPDGSPLTRRSDASKKSVMDWLFLCCQSCLVITLCSVIFFH
jgi:hypothetical protein